MVRWESEWLILWVVHEGGGLYIRISPLDNYDGWSLHFYRQHFVKFLKILSLQKDQSKATRMIKNNSMVAIRSYQQWIQILKEYKLRK